MRGFCTQCSTPTKHSWCSGCVSRRAQAVKRGEIQTGLPRHKTEKLCKVCGVMKPRSEYRLNRRGQIAAGRCLECLERDGWPRPQRVLHPRRRGARPKREKLCSGCGNTKPRAEFYINKLGQISNPQCKDCVRSRMRSKPRTDQMRATGLRWQRANRSKIRASATRRRARKLNAPVVDLTDQQWRDIILLHNGCCFYCGASGARLERDHVLPLTRGGSHTASNIVPACRSCNASKSTKTPEEWRAWIARNKAA